MQKIEKVFVKYTESRQFFLGSRVLQKQVGEMAKVLLILCVPFAFESVHQLLGKII